MGGGAWPGLGGDGGGDGAAEGLESGEDGDGVGKAPGSPNEPSGSFGEREGRWWWPWPVHGLLSVRSGVLCVGSNRPCWLGCPPALAVSPLIVPRFAIGRVSVLRRAAGFCRPSRW